MTLGSRLTIYYIEFAQSSREAKLFVCEIPLVDIIFNLVSSPRSTSPTTDTPWARAVPPCMCYSL